MAKKKTPIKDKATASTPEKIENVTESNEGVTDTSKQEEKESEIELKGMVEVVVTVSKFGNYAKGDTITMHSSTAKGCIDSKVVKLKK